MVDEIMLTNGDNFGNQSISLCIHQKKIEIKMTLDEKCFNGRQKVYQHYSLETKCIMKFSIYIPDSEDISEKFHVVLHLPGIMCNEQNFLFRTGFQKYASEQKLIVVSSDTSPRGVEFPGSSDEIKFGKSAAWYLDATVAPWTTHFRMYSYIVKELYQIITDNFPITGRWGLLGHSMGGNGAVVLGLKNPDMFHCITALSPAANPTSWGGNLIFRTLLGDDEESWREYDSSWVIRKYDGPHREIMVDWGTEDEYKDLSNPPIWGQVAEENIYQCVSIDLNPREGFGHSYYFVATYIQRHLEYQKMVLDNAEQ